MHAVCQIWMRNPAAPVAGTVPNKRTVLLSYLLIASLAVMAVSN